MIDFLKQSDQDIIDAMNAKDKAESDHWNDCFLEIEKETAKPIQDICEIVRKLSYKYDIGYREITDDMVLPFFEVEE